MADAEGPPVEVVAVAENEPTLPTSPFSSAYTSLLGLC